MRRFEQLESRRVLASMIDLAGGTLVITGDGDVNEVVIEEVAAPTSASAPTAKVVVTDIIAGVPQTPQEQVYPLPVLEVIFIDLGDGADSLISNLSSEILIVDGGAGSDTIVTGESQDYIFGRQGDDFISTGEGLNVVWGGNDDDVIVGADEENFFFGGNGEDVLVGGEARDILFGGGGVDVINAGGGRDVIDGQAGADIIDAGDDSELDVVFGSLDDIVFVDPLGLDKLF